MKEKMWKNKISRNTQLIFLSFLISILLWSYVRREKDIEISKVFKDVPVRYTDVSELKVNGLTILSPETAKVDIKIRGNISKISNLTPEDISATCNLKGYSTGDYRIKVDARVSENGVRVIDVNPKSLNFKIDDIITHERDVNVKASGTLSPSMILGNIAPTQKVSVEGPRTYVDTIDKLTAVVNLDGMSDSQVVTTDVVPYDADGNVVEKVNIIPEKINVDVPLLKTLTVPIKLNVVGEAPKDVVIKNLTLNPNTTTIKGNTQVVSKVKELTTEPININDILNDKVKAVKPILPEGTSLLDEESNFAVSYKLGNPGAVTVDVPVGNIEFVNAPKGYRIQTRDNLKFIQVDVEPLDGNTPVEISPEDIKISCDLENSKVQIQRLKFNIEVPQGYKSYSVTPESITVSVLKIKEEK